MVSDRQSLEAQFLGLPRQCKPRFTTGRMPLQSKRDLHKSRLASIQLRPSRTAGFAPFVVDSSDEAPPVCDAFAPHGEPNIRSPRRQTDDQRRFRSAAIGCRPERCAT